MGGTNDEAKQCKLGQKKIHDVCMAVVTTAEMQPGDNLDTHTDTEPKELVGHAMQRTPVCVSHVQL